MTNQNILLKSFTIFLVFLLPQTVTKAEEKFIQTMELNFEISKNDSTSSVFMEEVFREEGRITEKVQWEIQNIKIHFPENRIDEIGIIWDEGDSIWDGNPITIDLNTEEIELYLHLTARVNVQTNIKATLEFSFHDSNNEPLIFIKNPRGNFFIDANLSYHKGNLKKERLARVWQWESAQEFCKTKREAGNTNWPSDWNFPRKMRPNKPTIARVSSKQANKLKEGQEISGWTINGILKENQSSDPISYDPNSPVCRDQLKEAVDKFKSGSIKIPGVEKIDLVGEENLPYHERVGFVLAHRVIRGWRPELVHTDIETRYKVFEDLEEIKKRIKRYNDRIDIMSKNKFRYLTVFCKREKINGKEEVTEYESFPKDLNVYLNTTGLPENEQGENPFMVGFVSRYESKGNPKLLGYRKVIEVVQE